MAEKHDFSKMFLNAEIKPIPKLQAEMNEHEIEKLKQQIEDLCIEKEEICFHKKKAEEDLKMAISVTEELRQENQFLRGQIEAYKYCVDNIRR